MQQKKSPSVTIITIIVWECRKLCKSLKKVQLNISSNKLLLRTKKGKKKY